ncbi:hypothetical protein V8Z80_02535 [Orrella sp. JC864]|uniref:hypothetical protein n=1 Tax=Orrella sp. JC864 TaxID=3120298 RepID=UPI0012BC28B4
MSVEVKVTVEPTAGGTYKARLDVMGARHEVDSGDEALRTDEFDTPEAARQAGEKLAVQIRARYEAQA